ncbi:class D beta-lactamase [Pseudomonas sp. RIT-To-2]|uniref:class D beta-lactamase n=1 Tax=Pseudomonas sp. RIT-To-2 TaxID=3462541 RepID=UPI0024131EC5
MRRRRLAALVALLALNAQAANAALDCTLVTDASTGRVVHQSGDCTTRVTPASTYKLALSLMGFDTGYLHDAHTPTLDYRPGDPDWGGDAWRQPTDPARWIKLSVVWYSQRITHALGAERIAQYTRAFGYGNADLAGDPGKGNGLDRAWIGSSLKISPVEQATFLRKLVNRQLPVSGYALDMTSRLSLLEERPAGWEMHGKTGMAYPRDAAGVSDEAHAYGWFVGWALKDGRTLVFVRMRQDEEVQKVSAGVRLRGELLGDWRRLSSED